jgi:multiple sugar transport system substrate-binding protein
MMKKRLFAAFTAVAMVAGTFVGASSASAADRTVTVWSPYKGGNLKLWDAALSRIEKANPGLKINSVGSVDMAKSLAAINAGNGPDISVANGAGNLGWFCGTGAWQKLNTYVAGANGINMKGTFTPSAVNYTISSNNRCGLPAVGSETFGFYYNKDLLKAAGYDKAPRTTKELLDMSIKLTKFNSDGSIKVAGFVPWAGYYGFEMDAMWLGLMFGAKWYGGAGQPAFATDAKWAKAFNWQKDFIAKVYGGGDFKKGSQLLTKFVAARGDEWGAGHDFVSGRVAMKLDADWMAPMFCDPDGWALNPCTKPAVNFGTAAFPVDASILSTNYGSGLVGGQVMGISKGSKNVKDAWIVLKGLATDVTLSIEFANANGSVPVLNAALKSGKITYPAIYQTFYDIAANPKSGYHILKNTGEHLEDVEIYKFMSAWQAGAVSDLKSGLANVAENVSNILSRNY